jgi:hypothetical protein
LTLIDYICYADFGGKKGVRLGQVRERGQVGKRYGQLTVLKREGSKNGHAIYLCRCRCSKEVTVRGSYLRSGRQTSCGKPHKLIVGPSASKQDELSELARKFHHFLWVTNRTKEVELRDENTNEIVFTLKNNLNAPLKWITRCERCKSFAAYSERRIRSGLICKCLHSTRESWYAAKRRCGKTKAYKNVKFAEYWRRGNAGLTAFVNDVGVRPSKQHELGRIGDVGDYVKGHVKWMTKAEQRAEKLKKRQLKKQQENQQESQQS